MYPIKEYPKVSPTYEEVAAKHNLKPRLGGGCGSGWAKILDKLFTKLNEIGWGKEGEEVHQIKEKFGGLRIYLDGNQEAQDLVDQAAHESYQTCEVCGKRGKQRPKLPWLKTLCMGCYKIHIHNEIANHLNFEIKARDRKKEKLAQTNLDISNQIVDNETIGNQ